MATSGNLKQLCFVYEQKFKHLEMEYVKLEMNYDDGSKKTGKYQRFSGKEGIKGLLFVEDRFRNVASQLNCDQGIKFFDNWQEVLVDTAKDKWMTQVSGIMEASHTIPRFNAEIKKFYRKYCDVEAKDTVFEYLAMLQRPTKVTLQDHSNQIKTMFWYANKLLGLSLDLTQDQGKK
eukprot:1431082-Ditylum_brightwellii.AAC.1